MNLKNHGPIFLGSGKFIRNLNVKLVGVVILKYAAGSLLMIRQLLSQFDV